MINQIERARPYIQNQIWHLTRDQVNNIVRNQLSFNIWQKVQHQPAQVWRHIDLDIMEKTK